MRRPVVAHQTDQAAVSVGGAVDCQLSQGRSPISGFPFGRTSMSVKIRTTVCGAVIAAVGIAAALPASAATPQPRATLDAAPTWTAKASAGADASASQQLRMSVTLKLRNQAGAEALAQAVSTPDNKSYRKFVSAASWRSQFAPTDATVSSVKSWLSASGFTVGAVPANHRTVAFTGTVAQAEKAFGTSLKTFVK